MRLLAWVLMHNHFHLVLWPRRKGDVGRFMQWLTTCHVRRYHRHHGGTGHVWQGRFKCFPVAPGSHLLNVLRYVERNPVRAGLVKRVQDWRWSSVAAGFPTLELEPDPLDTIDLGRAKPLGEWLERGPTRRPKPWLRFVNREEDEAELARLRACVNRGTPYGDEGWSLRTARKLGLESTLRPRGRPRKKGK